MRPMTATEILERKAHFAANPPMIMTPEVKRWCVLELHKVFKTTAHIGGGNRMVRWNKRKNKFEWVRYEMPGV